MEFIGLGARDSLRLEMKMALYGNDISEETTAWEAGLGWIVKMDKGEFIFQFGVEDNAGGQSRPHIRRGKRRKDQNFFLFFFWCHC